MGSGISSRLALLAGVDEVDETTAKLIVDALYWSEDVQQAFDAARNSSGNVDRDTFLKLLKQQQFNQMGQDVCSGRGSHSSDNVNMAATQTAAENISGGESSRLVKTDVAQFRRKRPPLSLNLGVGSAAAGGAVKLGVKAAPLQQTRESKRVNTNPGGFRSRRPPGLRLAQGSAAGGGAVKIGAGKRLGSTPASGLVDTKVQERTCNARTPPTSKPREMNWMGALDAFDSPLIGFSADDSDELSDSVGLYQEDPKPREKSRPFPHTLSLSTSFEDLELTPPSRRRSATEETPHFSETGTFHVSSSFLVDAGGFRPSPASGEKHPVFERFESGGGENPGRKVTSLKDEMARQQPEAKQRTESGHDSDDMSVRSLSPGYDYSTQGKTRRQSTGSKKLSAEFVELYELGRGAGGRVYKAIHVPTLRPVALKRIKCNSPQKMVSLGQEITALAINYVPLETFADGHDSEATDAPCPYLTTFHGAYTSDDSTSITLILELMDGGELQEFVSDGRRCSEPLLANTAARILKGLSFLHSRKQVHRDIKPHNVLLHSQGLCKLSDFGILRSLEENEEFAETFTGTMLYMSPERVEGDSYSFPSDIWSLGLLLYTLAEAEFPFTDDSFFDLRDRFKKNDIPRLPLKTHPADQDGYSAECCDFVASMLQANPHARSTAAELLQHAFLAQHIEDGKRDKLDSTVVKAALVPTLHKKESSQSAKLRERMEEDFADAESQSFGSKSDSDKDLYDTDSDEDVKVNRRRAASRGTKPLGQLSKSIGTVGGCTRAVHRSNSGGNLVLTQARAKRRATFFENLASSTSSMEATNELDLTIRKIVKHQIENKSPASSRRLIIAFAKAMRVSAARALTLFEREWQKHTQPTHRMSSTYS